MTEQQFDRRLAEIETEYASRRLGAEAFRDQEVSRLFVQCGWTQERIGRRMGWTKGRVSQRLLFGRFLNVYHGKLSEPPPDSLTERRFRAAWSRSGKRRKETEPERFARVAALLAGQPAEVPVGYRNLVNKPGIKAAVAEALKAGQRLDVAQIVERAAEKVPDLTPRQVSGVLKALHQKPPPGFALEARHAGRSHKYRLVPRRKPPARAITSFEDACAFATEALPLIEECIDILQKPIVGRQTTLALDHLGKVRKALAQLFAVEGAV